MSQENSLFNIGVVERETGIGKDTLRVWERRYGFPAPVRDQHEERLYPAEQVERLRLIKRLLDIGMRPAKVVGLSMPELNALMTETPKNEPVYTEELLEYLEFIKAHQAAELRFALNLALMKQGMPDFLSKTVTPLNKLVGDAWLRGEVLVFEEHLYSEQITSVLRAANTIIRDHAGTPRVLLTTLPGEEHNLGLLMAEATLGLAGAQCTMLGVQTPIGEIVLAARAHQADIVALSFTMVMPPLQIKSGLQQLRQALPREVALWAGGSGVSRQRKHDDGVQLMGELSELTEAVGAWRAARSE
jgi:DNA-binding transcriptional MerR regulator/methylmalonyl-CoA mutase cobalamin-binding subunit